MSRTPTHAPDDQFANTEAAALSDETVSFSFGANWRKFVRSLTPEAVASAEGSLREGFAGHEIAGRTFLDIGCGSGLFSLAALRLGARQVLSVDADPNSVACTEGLRRSAGDPDHWLIRRGSILDTSFAAELEHAERIYSWGVLHHTGKMWTALESCLELVPPNGLFCVALYNYPNRPRAHLALKRAYNRLPAPIRPAAIALFALAHCSKMLFRRRNPVRYVQQYGERGMNYWRDIEDWLGGLPIEFASEDEFRAFLHERPFRLERVLIRPPGGNNEYLLRRLGD